MFKKEDLAWIELTNSNLKYALILVAIFIADYINLFPATIRSFEKLDIQEQIAINWQNVFTRGEKYSINECLEQIK